MVDAAGLAVRCYARPWRALAACLFALSRISLPWILWRVLTANDPPITPPLLAQMLLVVWALPGAAAWLIGRAFAACAQVDAAALVVERGAQRAVIERGRIAGLFVWRIPLPEPGFVVRLDDGRRTPFAIAARDPSPVLAALDPGAARRPLMVWAAARWPAPGWRYYVGRYVLFALFPAAVLFNAHQHIAYGALLGQYYLVGLGAWLTHCGDLLGDAGRVPPALRQRVAGRGRSRDAARRLDRAGAGARGSQRRRAHRPVRVLRRRAGLVGASLRGVKPRARDAGEPPALPAGELDVARCVKAALPGARAARPHL